MSKWAGRRKGKRIDNRLRSDTPSSLASDGVRNRRAGEERVFCYGSSREFEPYWKVIVWLTWIGACFSLRHFEIVDLFSVGAIPTHVILIALLILAEVRRKRTVAREPHTLRVVGTNLEVFWTHDTRCYPLQAVSVGEEGVAPREAPAILYRAKRIQAGEESFLVFSNLLGYSELLSLLSYCPSQETKPAASEGLRRAVPRKK